MPSTSLKAPERLGLDFILFKSLLVSLSEDRTQSRLRWTSVSLVHKWLGRILNSFFWLLPYCSPSGLRVVRECEYRLYKKVERVKLYNGHFIICVFQDCLNSISELVIWYQSSLKRSVAWVTSLWDMAHYEGCSVRWY